MDISDHVYSGPSYIWRVLLFGVFLTFCNVYASRRRFSEAVCYTMIAILFVLCINKKCHRAFCLCNSPPPPPPPPPPKLFQQVSLRVITWRYEALFCKIRLQSSLLQSSLQCLPYATRLFKNQCHQCIIKIQYLGKFNSFSATIYLQQTFSNFVAIFSRRFL